MKKLLSIIMAVAMIFTLGVTVFADSAIEYEVGSLEAFVFTMQEGDTIVKVSDVNDFISFGDAMTIGNNQWVVYATPKKAGVTQIIIDYKDAEGTEKTVVNSEYTTIVVPKVETPDQPGSKYLTLADLGCANKDAFKAMYTNKSVIKLDLTGFDGITGEVFNAATDLNPEKIVLFNGVYEVTMKRGDYFKLIAKEDIEINTMISVGSDLIIDGKDMNNKVLAALGNTKADPYYVTVETTNLKGLSSKVELTVKLGGADFDNWCKVNDCKSIDIYVVDLAAGTSKLVKSKASVNNLYDFCLEMPTIETGYYVLVESTTPVVDTTTKPNVSTGGAVASVFATFAMIGVAAIATRKISK